MKLSEIFLALASGELSNLHLSNDGQNIRPEKQEQVLRSINLGLTDLHTKFVLRKKQIVLPIIEGQQTYDVNQKDILEIIEVYKDECMLHQNHRDGYVLLKPTKLFLNTSPKKADYLTLQCKANHPILTVADIERDSDIDLPISYLNALLYYVGSRLFVSIPNQLDGDLNEGIRYQQRYQSEIVSLTNQGIDVDGLNENTWFNERGFV